MIQDGGRGPELVLALIAAISGRGSPEYTTFALPLVRDIAFELNVVAPAVLNGSVNQLQGPRHFEGSMSASRLDDWIEYVEYHILVEHLQARYPEITMEWNRQVRMGAGPTEPVPSRPTNGEEVAEFNRLTGQGTRRPRPRVREHPPPNSWAAVVVAIAAYVDTRRYGTHTTFAHRQLHMIQSLTSDLRNLTTSVPPPGFDRWASHMECSLWESCRNGASGSTDLAVQDGLGQAAVVVSCLLGRGGVPCLVLGLALGAAQPPDDVPRVPDDPREPAGLGQDVVLPHWLVAVLATTENMVQRGADGSGIQGFLFALAASRETPAYLRFVEQYLRVLRLLVPLPDMGPPPTTPDSGLVEMALFADNHMLGEFLVENYAAELELHHQAVLAGRLGTDDDLGPAMGETSPLRDRREQCNLVRRDSAMLRRLRQAEHPPPDPRGHRLSWVGEALQMIVDEQAQGFDMAPCLPLLRACVANRRFAEYEQGAAGYLGELEHEATELWCAPQCRCPENLATWAAVMEEGLWNAFVLHGLDL
ncbi:unnamed protein product, partial [Symbiodinium sp. CCMP2456]